MTAAKISKGKVKKPSPARRTDGRRSPGERKAVGRRTKRSARRVDGCELIVGVKERQGRSVDSCEVRVKVAGRGGRAVTLNADAARVLAAVGHPARLQVLRLLLKGPAVYRAVQKATRLQAGPLYHHVNQLRLAGLIRPKQRDLYELTRGGRNVILIAAALNKLAKDGRPRPVVSE